MTSNEDLANAIVRLQKSGLELQKSYVAMQRVTSLMKMSRRDNPYYPLVRVMVKLKLIKDWPV